MLEPIINIKEPCDVFSDATFSDETCEIRFNIDTLIKRCKEYDIDFYEYLARCINHEYLHHIFLIEHNNRVSHNLDNIARKYKDYWMW